MKKSILTLLGIGTACLACCLPLFAPVMATLGVSSVLALRVAGVTLDYILCLLLPLVAFAGLGVTLLLLARTRAKAACSCKSACQPDTCERR